MARGHAQETQEVTETPADTDSANGENKRVRRPTPEGEVISPEELLGLGNRARGGIWFERAKWFKDNPGQVKLFKGVSPTTATHLKKVHGLQAATRNTRDNGKTADLVVGYYPEGWDIPPVFRGRDKKGDSQ